jgi:hypothetical protein
MRDAKKIIFITKKKKYNYKQWITKINTCLLYIKSSMKKKKKFWPKKKMSKKKTVVRKIMI